MGAGNRWGQVYRFLDPQNIAVAGGRVSPVGVGGLTTGSKSTASLLQGHLLTSGKTGGISFYVGRKGWVCDQVRTFEVVLANGTIATASASSNRDLFRALKGGGNNFGIVTRFDLNAWDQKPFWGGTIAHAASGRDRIFKFFSTFGTSKNNDPYSAIITQVIWGEPGTEPVFANTVAYTDSNARWPPRAFRELEDLPRNFSSVRKSAIQDFTDEIYETPTLANGGNDIFNTWTLVNDPKKTPQFLEKWYQLCTAVHHELRDVEGLSFTAALQPLPYVTYSRPYRESPSTANVLGLDLFKDDHFNLMFAIIWKHSADNARVEKATKRLMEDIKSMAKKEGLFNEFLYLNYADKWQDVIPTYGKKNVQFLKDVSRKYDPYGVFQKAVPGGFKLPTGGKGGN